MYVVALSLLPMPGYDWLLIKKPNLNSNLAKPNAPVYVFKEVVRNVMCVFLSHSQLSVFWLK